MCIILFVDVGLQILTVYFEGLECICNSVIGIGLDLCNVMLSSNVGKAGRGGLAIGPLIVDFDRAVIEISLEHRAHRNRTAIHIGHEHIAHSYNG